MHLFFCLTYIHFTLGSYFFILYKRKKISIDFIKERPIYIIFTNKRLLFLQNIFMRTTRSSQPSQPLTDPQIEKLQHRIDEMKHQIVVMRRRIAEFMQNRNVEISPEEQAKMAHLQNLRRRLNEYRKKVGRPKNSNKSLLQFTIDKFETRQATIRELDEEIEKLETTFQIVKKQAEITKLILKSLNIPKFKDEFMKMDFSKCLILDPKVLKALRNMEFYTNEIKEKEKRVKLLQRDVNNLRPPEPVMKVAKHNTRRDSVKPAPEMLGCVSFEESRMKLAMKKINPILRKGKESPNHLSISFKNLSQKMNSSNKKLADLKIKINKIKLNNQKNSGEGASVYQEIKKKATSLNDIKKKIEANETDLQNLLGDDQKILQLSPEGLLKWRDDLLKQQKKNQEEYGNKIKKAQGQLKDAKFIKSKRIQGLKDMLKE